MTNKDIDLIKEMLQMQAKLDEAIMKEYGLAEIDKKNLGFAILDDIRLAYCGVQMMIFRVICGGKSGFSTVSVWFLGILLSWCYH